MEEKEAIATSARIAAIRLSSWGRCGAIISTNRLNDKPPTMPKNGTPSIQSGTLLFFIYRRLSSIAAQP
jgi:hypothetical protein